MEIANLKLITQFARRHPLARKPLERWMRDITVSEIENPVQLKERWPKASLIGNNRVVFDIHGNHYRLLVDIDYDLQIVYIERIGTHREYDTWNL